MKSRSKNKTARSAAPASPGRSRPAGHALFTIAIITACMLAATAAPRPGAAPSTVSIKNITDRPQLTFFPAGTVMSVGAYARITAKINIRDLESACTKATNSMKPLHTLLTRDSWPWQYTYEDTNLRGQYDEHRHRLNQACNTLKQWDKPDNFFREEPAQYRKRSFLQTAFTIANATNTFLPIAPEAVDTLVRFATSKVLYPSPHPSINTGLHGNATSTPVRDRRGIIATGISLVGGAIFLYNTVAMLFGNNQPAWEIEKLSRTTANSAKDNARHIAHLANNIKHSYYKDHFQLYINGLCDNARALSRLVFDVQNAFFNLQEGNVSPIFINAMDIESALENIEEQASKKHMHLAARSVADTLLLPAFGIKSGGMLSVVIPIPCITENLHLHRFAGTPLISAANDARLLSSPQPNHVAIAAAARSSNHILLNENDLNRCFKVRSTYMCASMPTRFDREESCLGALFAANSQAIHTRCTFVPHPEPWHIAHTTTNTYVLSSTIDMAATTTCPSGASHSISIPWGVTEITVPTGCTTQTPHFVITAPLVKFANVEIHKTISWDMALPATWGNMSGDAFAAIAHSAHVTQAQISKAIEVYEAKATTTPFWHHVAWGGGLVLLGAILATVAICKLRGMSKSLRSATSASKRDLQQELRNMQTAASAALAQAQITAPSAPPPAIAYNVARNAVAYLKQ